MTHGAVTSSLHPVLTAAATAAGNAYAVARRTHTNDQLAELAGIGADGTATMHIDWLVEAPILDVAAAHGVNALSEETGFVDAGSAVTLVVDPLDGSANAAAGVPLACFSAAIAVDGVFVQALTRWLHTGEQWAATTTDVIGTDVIGTDVIGGGSWSTTGRTRLDGAAVSLLRPQLTTWGAWERIAARAGRVRVLSCSTLEAVLVLTGATDAFADPGGDIHRLVDLAAAVVLAPHAGATVVDAHDRPIELDLDLTRRWSGIVAASDALAAELQEMIQQRDGP